mmetsp:Transcript_110720/g.220138  ORF Transcript_110720/g.220138 Transcript_110720/m.220138 type:complete len:97 (-) Transcript_110720:304-594(-)
MSSVAGGLERERECGLWLAGLWLAQLTGDRDLDVDEQDVEDEQDFEDGHTSAPSVLGLRSWHSDADEEPDAELPEEAERSPLRLRLCCRWNSSKDS